MLLGLWMQREQRSTCSSRDIFFELSNAPILIAAKKIKTNWMQMFPQRFIAFPAVYMYTTGGMRAVDPDVVVSNPKALSSSLEEHLFQRSVPQSA